MSATDAAAPVAVAADPVAAPAAAAPAPAADGAAAAAAAPQQKAKTKGQLNNEKGKLKKEGKLAAEGEAGAAAAASSSSAKAPKAKKESADGEDEKEGKEGKAIPAPWVMPEWMEHRQKVWDAVVAANAAAAAAQPAEPQPISITLPDGKVLPGVAGVTTPMDIAKGISNSLADRIIVARVSGHTPTAMHVRAPWAQWLSRVQILMLGDFSCFIDAFVCLIYYCSGER